MVSYFYLFQYGSGNVSVQVDKTFLFQKFRKRTVNKNNIQLKQFCRYSCSSNSCNIQLKSEQYSYLHQKLTTCSHTNGREKPQNLKKNINENCKKKKKLQIIT